MLFRRIARHVRNQEWTAIAIDLVIVIAGVFLGTQVSNWNEERVTRIRADAFEQRLRSDLREEAWSSQLLLQYVCTRTRCGTTSPAKESSLNTGVRSA